MTADTFAPWPEPPYVATLRSNVAALTTALDVITAACTEACDNRRRTYPTYGLVSAALIAAIAEEARA